VYLTTYLQNFAIASRDLYFLKVTAVTLHQSVMVDSQLEIKAYYAGHVLGAAMFWIRVGSLSVVYTGAYGVRL